MANKYTMAVQHGMLCVWPDNVTRNIGKDDNGRLVATKVTGKGTIHPLRLTTGTAERVLKSLPATYEKVLRDSADRVAGVVVLQVQVAEPGYGILTRLVH